MRRPTALLCTTRRTGTTLTEVLMSLLIMGIGVVSVATLFPLSVLKSVRATQGTTATTLRYNAESMIDGSRSDPVYDLISGVLRDNPRDVFPLELPPTKLSGCSTAAIALDPDGDNDPVRNDTNYDDDDHVYTFDGRDHREGYYVVDPLGYWRLRQQGEVHDSARFFGDWSGVGAPVVGGGVTWFINRFSLNAPDHSSDAAGLPFAHLRPVFSFSGTPASFAGGATDPEVELNVQIAEQVCGLPDSFMNLADGRQSEGAVTIAADSVTFAADAADFSMFLAGNAPDWGMLGRGKVTVFSNDGRRSVVRDIEPLAANWSAAGTDLASRRIQFKTPLPAWLVGNADRVTVDAIEDRYTWMLTVRNRSEQGARQALIDVVVFFRRAFGISNEHIYLVTQNFSSVSTFTLRKRELKEYFVAWNSATEPRPEIDEGDWMFDPENFRWHKIGQVIEEGAFTAPANAGWMRALSLPASFAPDRRIAFRMEGAQVADEVVRRGIFMQGVVDVFPLRPKTTD